MLEGKFRSTSGSVLTADAVERLIALVDDIENASDVGELVALLRG